MSGPVKLTEAQRQALWFLNEFGYRTGGISLAGAPRRELVNAGLITEHWTAISSWHAPDVAITDAGRRALSEGGRS